MMFRVDVLLIASVLLGKLHHHAPLQPVKVQSSMEMGAVDIMGPFPQTEQGNCYILDYFTKWLQVWAIPNQEAKKVACKLLNEMFYRFSLPDRLHLDQGKQFESRIIKELCRLLENTDMGFWYLLISDVNVTKKANTDMQPDICNTKF